jgi:protein O-mannosyl-transferase
LWKQNHEADVIAQIVSGNMLISSRTTRLAAIYLGLVGLVAVVSLQTAHFNFVNYDDGSYVFENANIRTGLTWHSVVWAFAHVHSQNWHPFTSISHMVDCQLFGLNAGAHHLVNVGLHAAAALLLFTFLWQSTNALSASAISAAIFAIHPLRVESVAWISERKDVLSGIFFMLTLLAYLRYVRGQSWQRMAVVAVCFAFGLMSKPMLVTTPIVLLLLDYWPLDRFRKQGLWKLILEKVPLVILAVGSCAATLIAQQVAIGSTESLPLASRIDNALVTYVNYLRQMFWPVDLVPFYTHPEWRLATWEIIGAIILLAGITAAMFLLRRKLPFLLVGWLWYIIMLLPVIGIIQVGLQARADRYTYLPQIGVIIAVVWAIRDLTSLWRGRTVVLVPASLAVIGVLSFLSYRQATHWHDTESLWSYTLNRSPENDVALTGLAMVEVARGQTDNAITHCRHALALREGNATAHYGLALALSQQRKIDEAIDHWQRSLEIQPDNINARNYLGAALAEIGRTPEAIEQWHQTLAFDPDNGNAANNLAWVLATSPDPTLRDGAQAVAYAQRATKVPGGDNPLVYRTLAAAYAENRQFAEAISAAEHAKQLAQATGNSALVSELDRCIELFRQQRTMRELQQSGQKPS